MLAISLIKIGYQNHAENAQLISVNPKKLV